MKRFILPLFAISLCGCPANPKIIKVQNGNEYSLSCDQLAIEINAAKQAKLDAHAEDHFRASDMFPPTGAMSVANIWRADSHATDRIELLNKLAQEKGCDRGGLIPQGNNMPPPQGMMMPQGGDLPYDDAPIEYNAPK